MAIYAEGGNGVAEHKESGQGWSWGRAWEARPGAREEKQ